MTIDSFDELLIGNQERLPDEKPELVKFINPFRNRSMHRFLIVSINLLALILVLTASIFPGVANKIPSSFNKLAGNNQIEQLQYNYNIYLPVVIKEYTGPPTIFGNETTILSNTDIQDKSRSANVYWVRSYVFSWNLIEPVDTTPANYNWESVDGQALINAASRRLHVIATIKMTPSWAQKYSGYLCGPVAKSKFSAFAEFLQEVVRIYSKPPYNIKYWELGNEPDIDRNLVPPDSEYGCWGEESDTYYGGGFYADMLKVVYPAIKSVDPNAQVLIGGLLLDCDPTHPVVDEGKTCKPGKFLEGILRNGGASYFDIVSFHGYPYYAIYQDPNKTYPQYLYYDEHHKYWISRGGIVLGKINFLNEVMASRGVSKPIIASEAALTCSSCGPNDPVYEEAKADYVVWLYVRNLAIGVLGTTWYTMEGPGWRYAGLLDEDQNPRPAYNALRFLARELTETTYQGVVTQFTYLRGYQFGNSWRRIWVLWAPDEQPYTINLPTGATAVYDKYGVVVTPESGRITIKSPVYIEFPP